MLKMKSFKAPKNIKVEIDYEGIYSGSTVEKSGDSENVKKVDSTKVKLPATVVVKGKNKKKALKALKKQTNAALK